MTSKLDPTEAGDSQVGSNCYGASKGINFQSRTVRETAARNTINRNAGNGEAARSIWPQIHSLSGWAHFSTDFQCGIIIGSVVQLMAAVYRRHA
jgi:hypothetical protein